LPHAKQVVDQGAVGWAGTDMVNRDDPVWIDEHVTALLLRIGLWPTGQLPLKQFVGVRPPHRGAQEILEFGLHHAVGVI
jgi:hypothetical protein